MYHYRAFNLNLVSPLPLPELMPGDPTQLPDLRIVLNDVPSRGEGDSFWWEEDRAFFHWAHAGTFMVQDGSIITVDPNLQEEGMWRLPLLGGVIAMALQQRGLLVLHASAVAVEGEAVVFIGEKGQGKSTTAASLFHRGHPLISDDLVAIDLSDPLRPTAIPSFPQFKLWPDSVSAFGEEPEDLPRLNSACEKRFRNAGSSFETNPVALNSIFVLGEGQNSRITSLPPQSALRELFIHSYCSRYGRRLMNAQAGSEHFARCLTVVKGDYLFGLEKKRSLSELNDLAELIESHAMQHRPQTSRSMVQLASSS
jgi:hypothetical protein